METVLFWVLAALTVGAALGAAASRDPGRCALALLGAALGAAGLLALLGAPFVAAARALVGAAAGLGTWALAGVLRLPGERRGRLRSGLAAALAGLLLLLLGEALWRPGGEGAAAVGEGAVAVRLFDTYLLAAGLAVLLLLAALVGAVVLGRGGRGGEGDGGH